MAKEKTTVRTRRAPIGGSRNVLTVEGKEEGFHYRWVNDTGDRIEHLKSRGYEIVTHKVSVGDKRVASTEGVGAAATANVGGGIKAVLMRISDEYKAEDDAAKREVVDATEAAIRTLVDPRTGESLGDYGTIGIGSNKT